MRKVPLNSSREPAVEAIAGTKSKAVWKRALDACLYATTSFVAPVSFSKNAKFGFRLSLGKVLTAACLMQGVAPLSGYLLPTADDYLSEKGLGPVAAGGLLAELAPGRDIRVMTDDVAGYAYAFLRAPVYVTLLGRNSFVNGLRDKDVMGVAFNHQSFMLPIGPDVIFVKEKAIESRLVYGQSLIDAQEVQTYVALHELRHASAANHQLSTVLEKEADADYAAIKYMADELGGGIDFTKRAIMFKAKTFSQTHDTVLYLDAKFNARAVPSVTDMEQANLQAESYVYKHGYALASAAFCKVYNDDHAACEEKPPLPEQFTDLARRRIDLYNEATREKMILDKELLQPQALKTEVTTSLRPKPRPHSHAAVVVSPLPSKRPQL